MIDAYIKVLDRFGNSETFEAKMKNGEYEKTRKYKAHSYLMQLIQFLYVQMTTQSLVAPNQPIDKDAAANNLVKHADNMLLNGGAGGANPGIQVGTDNTAVNISQHALVAMVANGNGAGQLNYAAVGYGLPAVAGSSCSFTLSRTLTGNAVDAINVKEVGIMMVGWSGAAQKYYLLERSLMTFTIPVATPKTVTYTLRVTV